MMPVLIRSNVLQPKYRIDVSNHRQYMQQLQKLIESGVDSVEVDLRDVSFLDTYGLSVLVKGCKLAQGKGISFKVSGVTHPAVKMIFAVTNIGRLFPVVE